MTFHRCVELARRLYYLGFPAPFQSIMLTNFQGSVEVEFQRAFLIDDQLSGRQKNSFILLLI